MVCVVVLCVCGCCAFVECCVFVLLFDCAVLFYCVGASSCWCSVVLWFRCFVLLCVVLLRLFDLAVRLLYCVAVVLLFVVFVFVLLCRRFVVLLWCLSLCCFVLPYRCFVVLRCCVVVCFVVFLHQETVYNSAIPLIRGMNALASRHVCAALATLHARVSSLCWCHTS